MLIYYRYEQCKPGYQRRCQFIIDRNNANLGTNVDVNLLYIGTMQTWVPT